MLTGRQGSSSHAAPQSVFRPGSLRLEQDVVFPTRVHLTLSCHLPTWVFVHAIPGDEEGLLQQGTRVSV